jgi:hypothetical protein
MWRGIIAAISFAIVLILPCTDAAARMWCIFKSSYLSGTSRICIYDCAGSERHETIGAAQMCPLNVEQ